MWVSIRCCLVLCLFLTACGGGAEHVLTGAWKDLSQERYLLINKGASRTAGLGAVIYAPGTKGLNHLELKTSMRDGGLVLHYDEAEIPVLYDPSKERVVLNGTDEYQRINADILVSN